MLKDSKRFIRRTVSGESAWKNLALPPDERKLLGFLKESVSEDEVRIYMSQDCELLMASFVRRGWAKWSIPEVQKEERSKDFYQFKKDDGAFALERLRNKMSLSSKSQDDQDLVIEKTTSDKYVDKEVDISFETNESLEILLDEKSPDDDFVLISANTEEISTKPDLEGDDQSSHPQLRGDVDKVRPTNEEIEKSLNSFLNKLG